MIGIKKNIGQKKTITENDLANLLYQELKKYNGQSGPKARPRGVVDGQQVDNPVLALIV